LCSRGSGGLSHQHGRSVAQGGRWLWRSALVAHFPHVRYVECSRGARWSRVGGRSSCRTGCIPRHWLSIGFYFLADMRTQGTKVFSRQGINGTRFIFRYGVGVVRTCPETSTNRGAVRIGGAGLSGSITLAWLWSLARTWINWGLLFGCRSLTGGCRARLLRECESRSQSKNRE